MIIPVEDEPSSLHTRPTLLFRLRDWQDRVSWEEFYRLYRDFVYGLCRQRGLGHAEAEEVTQDVFVRVAKTIHDFESNPARGSFRGWLAHLTRWRVADKYRTRKPDSAAPHRGNDDPEHTRTIERIADEKIEPLDGAAEAEWQKHVLATALARLARRVPAKHFQAFELYARQGWPVLRVSSELGLSIARVYLIRHRLTKQLKAEVDALRAKLD